jgi:uncharacterized protein (TIGR02001 family)
MRTKTLMPSAAVLVAFTAAPAVATAELSANIGWVSQYVYRGIFQESSSAFAGIDYEAPGGFYIGAWGADVGQGLETDLYFGYAGGNGDFSYSIGATGYYYTDDFDDTYQELNLGVGYGIFSLDLALGEWDGFGDKERYTFTAMTFSPEVGPYFTIGSFGRDFSGEYLEIGYERDVGGVDFSVALLYSDNLQVGRGAGDYTLVFGISRTLGLGRRALRQ